MVSISTIAAVMSCGLLLCASYVASGADVMKAGQLVSRDAEVTVYRIKSEEGKQKGVHTIRGEVLRIEGDSLVVERSDGKKVNLHIDETTKMGSFIGRGDRIEANVRDVNDQEHVLTIRVIE